MTRVFAFIGGRPQVGQSTIAAELAFEWVKRGASACILTTGRRADAMGFDCFELASLAPPKAGRARDLAALAADLAQLEDYDYVLLDLPPGSVDLAIAAGLSGAELVVPVSIEQGALSELGGMFKAIARRPPPRPLRLVLNQVRSPAAAAEAAGRLMTSVGKKLKLSVDLTATLPWDPDLAALADAAVLLGTTLPAAALVQAIGSLADALNGGGNAEGPVPVAMVFWEQFQTLLQQPAAPEADPIDLSEPLVPPPPRAAASAEMAGAAPAPELTAILARIAASLERLSDEVGLLRRGLAGKFEFEDQAGRREGMGAPIRLDFEGFRRARGDGDQEA
jgi:MinD-like ATPase involved in chromosome partitioning or flagellar assembly